MLYGERKQNDLLMLPTEGMTFSEKLEKKMQSHLFHFSTHLMLLYSWLVTRKGRVKSRKGTVIHFQ